MLKSRETQTKRDQGLLSRKGSFFQAQALRVVSKQKRKLHNPQRDLNENGELALRMRTQCW